MAEKRSFLPVESPYSRPQYTRQKRPFQIPHHCPPLSRQKKTDAPSVCAPFFVGGVGRHPGNRKPVYTTSALVATCLAHAKRSFQALALGEQRMRIFYVSVSPKHKESKAHLGMPTFCPLARERKAGISSVCEGEGTHARGENEGPTRRPMRKRSHNTTDFMCCGAVPREGGK